MQKISDSTNTANPAGEFTEGNPAAGVPATLLKAPWLNAIQRERAALLLGAGINLNASDDSQVLKAVKALASVAADFNKLTNKPTTLGGYGITDAFTKPEATSAIQQAISNLVASSPAALDTLKELASALGNDPNFATTMTNALAGKASKATTLGGYGITDAFTKPETSAAIQQAIAALVASSPAALDTLKELADALGNDPNFATTMTNALAGKASKATTLGGYGISDAYTKTEITGFLNSKLNSSFCANAGFTDSTAAQPFMTHSNGITVGLARQDAALGVAQTWQDVKASRAANTNYTNTTGRPIQVNITTADANARSLTVGGVVAGYTNSTYGGNYFLTAIVPPGSTYSYSGTFSNWAELRS